MNKQKTLKTIQMRVAAVLAGVLCTAALTASAQEGRSEEYVSYPQAFISLQAGGQTTFTDYNNWKLFTPTASIGVGVHFTPVIGARLHVNGIWNKSAICTESVDEKFKYKYATADLDVMLNMVNLIAKGNYHPLNVYLIGGVGINYAWDNDDVPALRSHIATIDGRNRLTHNYRIGTMLDVRVAPNWSVNLEVAGNSLGDRFNSKNSGSSDWQLTAQVGVTYRFGKALRLKSSKKEADVAVVEPAALAIASEPTPASTNTEVVKPETKPAPAPTPKPEPQPAPAPAPAKPAVTAPKDISRNIFFDIREATITPTEQVKLAEVAKWLKENPSAKVTVTGYADRETGTATINSRLSRQRAETVAKELTKKYGIKASRIATKSKGDTEQPFTDNDMNRVSIVVANVDGD